MSWFSFHGGHSGSFCRYAKDDLVDVVERAIALGFTHYGLSEHAPRFRTEDLLSDELDLTPADLQSVFNDYRLTAQALRDDCANRLAIFVGFETERLPPGDLRTRMAELRRSGFDYVVGSVHDMDGRWLDVSPEQTSHAAEAAGGFEQLHLAYFDAVADLVAALKPEVVGHIDLVRKFEPAGFTFSKRVMTRVEQALQVVRDTGAVLDVNCGAWRRGYGPVYPLPEILRLAHRMGIGVTLGDDSHGVASVGVGLEASVAAIREAGYHEVQRLERYVDGVYWAPVSIAELRPLHRVDPAPGQTATSREPA
jgi:histidinol-phosphatase (PHP family)